MVLKAEGERPELKEFLSRTCMFVYPLSYSYSFDQVQNTRLSFPSGYCETKHSVARPHASREAFEWERTSSSQLYPVKHDSYSREVDHGNLLVVHAAKYPTGSYEVVADVRRGKLSSSMQFM